MPNFRYSPRIIRHKRVRSRLHGTAECPRLVVTRSLKHISAQLVNDKTGKTICAVFDSKLKSPKSTKPMVLAGLVGKQLANQALAQGVKAVVFDRAGHAYHGRVRALAEGAREGGLQF